MPLSPLLERRLDLLLDSGQIDSDIAAFVRDALPHLAAAVGQTPDADQFASLCTHSALALQRERNGASIQAWDVDHTGELAGHPRAMTAARAFVERAATELGLTLPARECDFVALHLAAIESRAA